MGLAVNADRYSKSLRKVKTAIKNHRRSLLSKGAILLQDNAHPHVAKHCTDLLKRCRWEVLDHPPYSPDLAPCNFHVLEPLRNALKGCRFSDDNEVRASVEEWFRMKPKTFFQSRYS
ncbi:hypothetical protein AVEN_33502-1 [Araneus ventricosus]|uniref:Mariner Mos1 transposase n=1 Tax=Araneus ventricosus TaxID=182803 RepID=A0A4Y2L763_ARAVE|nr:hypothetical protein AVEN_33502-1 [Araneus ventricosus]